MKVACPARLKILTRSFIFFSRKQKTTNMKTLKALIVSLPKFHIKFLGRHREKDVLKISTQYQELRVTEKLICLMHADLWGDLSPFTPPKLDVIQGSQTIFSGSSEIASPGSLLQRQSPPQMPQTRHWILPPICVLPSNPDNSNVY